MHLLKLANSYLFVAVMHAATERVKIITRKLIILVELVLVIVLLLYLLGN